MTIISRYLSTDDIVADLGVPDKGRAFEEIASIVERNHKVSHGLVLSALWRRERIGSTAIGHGIAIPHARIEEISEPIVLFVRTRHPIVFNSPDHMPVSVLLVILVPEHATEEHLQILASATEKFSDRAFRDRLEAAKGRNGRSPALRRDAWVRRRPGRICRLLFFPFFCAPDKPCRPHYAAPPFFSSARGKPGLFEAKKERAPNFVLVLGPTSRVGGGVWF